MQLERSFLDRRDSNSRQLCLHQRIEKGNSWRVPNGLGLNLQRHPAQWRHAHSGATAEWEDLMIAPAVMLA